MRAIILGLDGAGKTTLLYNLHLGEIVRTIPTIGFNVERVKYKNCNFHLWDVGGQTRMRKLASLLEQYKCFNLRCRFK